ncbi:MAG TPA: NADH-quinone oxidoreductase subunit NuoH [Thermoanaerobaculia bacterium]|nr:NADH-quinone oxidoreductase subunit NuoH [Thermoanaerobaculia bacterium]
MSIETWATLAKFAVWLAALMGIVAPIMVWVERRGMALIQDRRGPNRVGPFGLIQPLADALKFIFKEEIVPTAADRTMYLLGPILALVPALTTFLVIPMAPDLDFRGHHIPMVVIDGEAGVLLFLALSSLGVYSLVTSGYGSNNKYSQMGAVRASAQLISYELAMAMAILAVLLPVGSFRLSEVVAWQQHHLWHDGKVHVWNVIAQLPGFLVFLIASFAETNRLPFDLPEAESELVSGYGTEYGSMKWALFFMGEYINMASLSALMSTLYLGGWSLPGVTLPAGWLGVAAGAGILATKVVLWMFFFVWVRFTFPRFRYDQLMALGWKVLLPISLLTLVAVAALTVAGVY